MTRKAGVVVIDPFPIWNLGVAEALRSTPDFEVLGDGASAADAQALIPRLRPALALIDAAAASIGFRCVRQLAAAHPDTRIAIFTASERKEDLKSAMAAGAHGYLLKSVSPEELARSLRAIQRGERHITPDFAVRMLASIGVTTPERPRQRLRDELTAREGQILEEAAKGKTNKEIAEALKLSEKTVKYYMTNVLQKLQVRNRVEAINVYRDNGWAG